MAGLQELSTRNGEEFHGTVLRSLPSLISRGARMECVWQLQNWAGIVTACAMPYTADPPVYCAALDRAVSHSHGKQGEAGLSISAPSFSKRTRTWGKRTRVCYPWSQAGSSAHRRWMLPLCCWALMGPWGCPQRPDYRNKRTHTTNITDSERHL